MDRFFSRTTKLDAVLLLFVSIMLLSFHLYFIYFVNSSYVTAFVGEKWVSTIYLIGAVFNIWLFLKAPKILRKYGNMKMAMTLSILEIGALLALAFPMHPLIAIGAFLVHMTVSSVLIYNLDMFLEQYSKPEEMGSMRGMFLTMWNLPPIITPFIAGLILGEGGMPAVASASEAVTSVFTSGIWKIYLISAAFMIPFIFFLRTSMSGFKDPEYPRIDIKETLKHFYADKNIFDVFADRVLLNLYFAWSVVYMPIYLYDHIGFTWNEIGIILSVMLLPFVLFQRTIGKAQDRKHQEKGTLIAGFIILTIGTLVIPLMTNTSVAAWALLFFMTHIGASLIEVSSESYFFHHVKPNNSGYISLFRMTRTLPYLVMPALVAISLALFPFKYMFVVLGLFMLLGIRYAFMIEETPEEKQPTLS